MHLRAKAHRVVGKAVDLVERTLAPEGVQLSAAAQRFSA
jgi:hypothetical protein